METLGKQEFAGKHEVCRQPSKLRRVGFDFPYPLQSSKAAIMTSPVEECRVEALMYFSLTSRDSGLVNVE